MLEETAASATTADDPIASRLLPHHTRLVPNSLRTNPVQTQILPLMQPYLRRRQLLALQQIRRPEDRTARQVIRIDSNDPSIFVVQPRKVARDLFGVGVAAVDADEGRRDVGLLVEVGQAEAVEVAELVDDGGLVLGAEAGAEVVLCLGAGAVDAVDEGGDGFWAHSWVGERAHVGAGWEVVLGNTGRGYCWIGLGRV
jgi:hypothetical protein